MTFVHQQIQNEMQIIDFYSNYCYEMFEDTKRVIIIRKSKKDRQHNGQRKKGQKDKQRSTNIHIKLKME